MKLLENPSKRTAYMRRYRETHPDHKKYQKQYHQGWRIINRSRVRFNNRAMQHNRTALIRQTVATYKIEKGCAICGYNSHPDALQFDHIVPLHKTGGKRYESLVSWAMMEKVLTDPNVQVLCANCHSIKTVRERRELQASKRNG